MIKLKKKDSSKPAATRRATLKAKNHADSDEARHVMIAETAYYYAEQRGFEGEAALDDWLRAESDINTRLATSE